MATLSKKSASLRFFLGGAAMLAVLSGAAFTAHAQSFTDAQKSEIGDVIKSYLTENPQVVLQALEAYQKNEEEMRDKMVQEKISTLGDQLQRSDDPVIGAKDGDVMIVEFFDYNCGYCKHAFADLMKLVEKDKKVKVVFKELPILSESSKTAARYAIAANKQGKYFEFHSGLMQMQGEKNEGAFKRIAEKVGIDFEQLKKDAADPAVDKHLEENMGLAGELGVRGTPGFIIGDKLFPGYIELESMEKAVAAVREGKKG